MNCWFPGSPSKLPRSSGLSSPVCDGVKGETPTSELAWPAGALPSGLCLSANLGLSEKSVLSCQSISLARLLHVAAISVGQC